MPAWPPGQERTPPHRRNRADFHSAGQPLTFGRAISRLQRELRASSFGNLRVDADMHMRKDDPNIPLANQPKPKDPGVVVYFTRAGQQIAMACDTWDRVEDNIAAIAKTIEAKRLMIRWGVATQHAEYQAYAQLPPGSGEPIVTPPPRSRRPHEVLGVAEDAPFDVVRAAFRARSLKTHPDRGGDREEFEAVQEAWAAMQLQEVRR